MVKNISKYKRNQSYLTYNLIAYYFNLNIRFFSRFPLSNAKQSFVIIENYRKNIKLNRI